MKHILDIPGFYLIEKDKKFAYKRIYDPNGIPNYYPPLDKSKLYTDMDIDEIMFFPIESETYQTDHKHKFYAFRYLFCSSGHTTVALTGDPFELGWTFMQVQVEVHRVRYTISQNGDIVIDKICDALHPTKVIQIKDRSVTVGRTLEETILNEVKSLNKWYMDKTV